MLFEIAVLATALIAGTIAAITGFGIGSLITPLLSLSIGTKLAIGLVSIPHFIGTFIRFWILRKHIDKKVFLQFGILSAVGGLAGALLQILFATPAITLTFGLILLFAGLIGVAGISERLRLQGASVWIAGILSGLLGGLVGNQGGIRSAALLGFKISKESFVATATAVGLIVDISRMPIYFWTESQGIFENWKWLLLSTVGVLGGTFLGVKVLRKLPEKIFRQSVSAVILFLGIFMIYKGMK